VVFALAMANEAMRVLQIVPAAVRANKLNRIPPVALGMGADTNTACVCGVGKVKKGTEEGGFVGPGVESTGIWLGISFRM